MRATLVTTTLVILGMLLPSGAADAGHWDIHTGREGTTTAGGDLVQVTWSTGSAPWTTIVVETRDTPLFSLLLPTHDGAGGHHETDHRARGSWLAIAVPPEPVRPVPDLGIRLHDVAHLAATVQCAAHPPEPVAPPEACRATFPEGALLAVSPDGGRLEVRLPRQEDGSPGAKLSWVGFNPQPEPPAAPVPEGSGITGIDGTTVSFRGTNIQVSVHHAAR